MLDKPTIKPRADLINEESEESLQKAVVQLLKFNAAPNVFWYHVPNGGKRNKKVAIKLKLAGVRAGVADLAFVLPGGQAAFLELKAMDGRQSLEQREFQRDVITAQGLYRVAKGFEEARTVLKSWGAVR